MKAKESTYKVQQNLNSADLWNKGGPELSRLDIELTERCNNKCIHCYINQPEDDQDLLSQEMTTAEVKNILDQAAELGCLTVRYTGGEPLLRPDFQEIYLYTRRLGIKVTLLTNATLISQKHIDLFTKYPPGEPVEVTLYGMSPKTYEKVSLVKGSFTAAMNGINQLVRNNIPLALRGIWLSAHQNETEEFQNFAKSISADGQSGSLSLNFNLRGRRDNLEKNQRIAKLRATPQETLEVLTKNKEDYLHGKKLFIPKFMHPGGEELFNCGCGKGGTVDAYGRLQPCLLLRDPDLTYDLRKGNIKDALRNYFPKALKHKSENPQYIKQCSVCFLQGLCEQCPAWSWMESGTLDSPVTYLCAVAHKQAEYLGLLKPGEKSWEVTNWQDRIKKFAETFDNKEEK